MVENLKIAAYCRISVDTEIGIDNTSIENQKAIIIEYIKSNFPTSKIDFYEDRDQSGYTFAQREHYQKLRRELEKGKYDILVIKDFSRFSRRNGLGLVELEDLRDMGVRIISIGDSVDYPTHDDWLKIQIHFFVNEMPVTETSKKVRSVIKSRQKDGKWICAVPYGYIITDTKKMTFKVDEPSANIVRMVFDLYNKGWGYKKIANYLTDLCIPTPRTVEKERRGADCKIKSKKEWSIITIQGILDNDFYIGTLRQGKFTRKKINGADIKCNEDDHIVIENNHPNIVDYRVWAIAREERKKRAVMNYRGVKIYENAYSGFLYCGDCNSPMFSMSRSDVAPAYRCGAYHNRGLAACTSHHTRVDFLDELLKSYIRKVKDNSSEMLNMLNQAIKNEKKEIHDDALMIDKLKHMIQDSQEELKITKRQRIREIIRRPEQEEQIELMYDDLEQELMDKIEGLENQITLSADRKNTIIKTNRIAKTAIEIFDKILEKQSLDKHDLGLIIERIVVYKERIEVKLKSDIDGLLNAQNFPQDAPIISQKIRNHKQKDLCVSVIGNGDPLEIFTDKNGEVIFKKYSPISELGTFASQYAETLSKTSGYPAVITDKDNIIAVSGVSKKELVEKKISIELERVMQEKYAVVSTPTDTKTMPIVEGNMKYSAAVVYPILAEGDSVGSVVFLTNESDSPIGEVETKLAQSAAGFLGKQMEQ